MTMIANTTEKIDGSRLWPHMFQDWREDVEQKYVAQTLLSVPASPTIIIAHRQECLCHTTQIAIPLVIRVGAFALNGKSYKRAGIPRSARDDAK